MTTKTDKGIYMILGSKHLDYSIYTQDIKNVATHVANFKPRLSLDGSKAIIQIKQSYNTQAISWVEKVSDRSAVVLDAGDVEWARAEMHRGYTLEKGNEWEPPDSYFDNIVPDGPQG